MLKITEGLAQHEEDNANNIPLLRRLKDLYKRFRNVYDLTNGAKVPCKNAFICAGYDRFEPEFLKYHSLVLKLSSQHPMEASWVSISKKYFSNLAWNQETINVGWTELYLASKRVLEDTYHHESSELTPIHSLHEMITIALERHSTKDAKFLEMSKLHQETKQKCACMGRLLHATNQWR